MPSHAPSLLALSAAAGLGVACVLGARATLSTHPAPPPPRVCTLRLGAGLLGTLSDPDTQVVTANLVQRPTGLVAAPQRTVVAGSTPTSLAEIPLGAYDDPHGPTCLVVLDGGTTARLRLLPAATQAYVEDLAHDLGVGRDALLQTVLAALADPTLRPLAIEDLEALAERAPLLPATSQQVLALTHNLPASDPTTPRLLLLVALHASDPAVADALLDQLARPAWAPLLPVVADALNATSGPAQALVDALVVRAGTQASAADLLSRLAVDEAAQTLGGDVNDPDPARRAAAFVALAGGDDASATAAAWDRIRPHLASSPLPTPTTELEQLLASRAVAKLRRAPSPAQTELMAAGYYLLRVPGGQEAAALTAALDRLDDRAVARFLRARASEPWTDVDAPW